MRFITIRVHDKFESTIVRPTARGRRVVLLLVGIAICGVADLVLTLTVLRSTGMAEANPIAAFVIRSTGSATVLSIFKLSSLAFCSVVLFRLRLHRQCEVAAWFGMVVYILLSLHWHQYSTTVMQWTGVAIQPSEHWLYLDE